MAVDQPLGKAQVVHWIQADILRDTHGRYLLPVELEYSGQRVRTHVPLSPDQAAVLHAQLTRHLESGWAMTEHQKAVKRKSSSTI